MPFVSVRVRNGRTEEPNYGDEHSSMRQTKLFYTSFRHFRDAFFRALVEADAFGWLWRRIKVVSYAFNLRCALNSIGALRQEARESWIHTETAGLCCNFSTNAHRATHFRFLLIEPRTSDFFLNWFIHRSIFSTKQSSSDAASRTLAHRAVLLRFSITVTDLG